MRAKTLPVPQHNKPGVVRDRGLTRDTGHLGLILDSNANENSFENSALFAGITALAGAMIKHRAVLGETVDGQFVPLDRQPDVLTNPTPDMSMSEFLEMMTWDAVLRGNFFALPVWDEACLEPLELWPIGVHQMRWERSPAGELMWQISSWSESLPSASILHCRAYLQTGEVMGMSALALGKKAFDAGVSADKFAASFWKNGANPGLIVSMKEATDDDWKEAKAAVRRSHSGVSNAWRTMVLRGDVAVDRLSMPPEESQFLKTREHNSSQVSQWLGGLPPYKLGDFSGTSAYKSLEEQERVWLEVLGRWRCRFEEALSQLFPRGSKVKLFSDSAEIGTLADQTAKYSAMIQHGAMNPNEWRRIDGLPPRDGGDEYFVAANLQRVRPKEMTEQERWQLFRELVSIGFKPEDTARKLGLTPIEHTNILPTTLHGVFTPELDDPNKDPDLS